MPALSTLDSAQPLTNANDTLTWDFGNPVPGLEYDIAFLNPDDSTGIAPANQMLFHWQICKLSFGLCQPANQKTLEGDAVRHLSFADPGKYVVKLVMKDRYRQFDTRERLIVATDISSGLRMTMLQEIMERCGRQFGMDAGELIIELAYDVASRNAATTAHPGLVAEILHNTGHINYDNYVQEKLNEISRNSGFGDPRELGWSNIDCGAMIGIVKTAAGELRNEFLKFLLPASVLREEFDPNGNKIYYLR